MSETVKNDPQGSIFRVLRPPRGFEAYYTGQPTTTPIPFVERDQQREYRSRDMRAGQAGVDPNLARYVPVPFAASLAILIPRALLAGEEQTYSYELRWRLRSVVDWTATQQIPYHVVTEPGASDATVTPPASPERITIPAYTSQVITPSVIGGGVAVLVGAGVEGVAGQGIYDPDTLTPNELAYAPNLFFPPIWVRCEGDDLSIVAFRPGGGEDPPEWDFEDENEDGPFSNVFGEAQHAAIPSVGIYLFSGVRSTTP